MTLTDRLQIREANIRDVPGWGNFHAFYEAVASWLPQDFMAAEIGVLFGRTVRYLCEETTRLQKSGKLYAIDHYKTPMDQVGLPYPVQGLDQWSIFRRYTAHLPIIPIVENSDEAANRFDDETMDFVFIDGDHSESAVRKDVIAWWPKIKIGGIMSGDDFCPDEPGVMKAAFQTLGPVLAGFRCFMVVKGPDGKPSHTLPPGHGFEDLPIFKYEQTHYDAHFPRPI